MEDKKILIVDDHKIFSESLMVVLENNGFSVKVSNSVDNAINTLKASSFDIVITDIEMPDKNGVDLIKTIKQTYKDKLKFIVLTSYSGENLFSKLMKLNIDAFLNKNISNIDLLSVIKKVIRGEKYFQPEIYNKYLKNTPSEDVKDLFTPRELEVLKFILEEKTTNQIASSMSISNFTVEGHRKSLLQKTNSKNVVGLIKFALNNNLF